MHAASVPICLVGLLFILGSGGRNLRLNAAVGARGEGRAHEEAGAMKGMLTGVVNAPERQ
jgi:hypothetical protein